MREVVSVATSATSNAAVHVRLDAKPPDAPTPRRQRTLSRLPGLCDCASAEVLTEALVNYYAPANSQCGVNFLDGSEVGAPTEVTAEDLFAVTNLGIRLDPGANRRLLGGPSAVRIRQCLSPEELPLDRTLAEAEAVDMVAMLQLHTALLEALAPGSEVGEDEHAAASAISARKRPELFPVLDRAFTDAMHLPPPSEPVRYWQLLQAATRDGALIEHMRQLFGRAASEAGDGRLDIYLLRRLYVLVVHVLPA